jgi:GNAT superfamily N-acetyltransferase
VQLSSQVERATAADLAQLAALRIEQGWYGSEALLGAIAASDHGRHFALRASALGEDAALDPAFIVAAASGVVAGPVAVIGNVITRPGLRGRGLGRAVMSATLTWLREYGARAVLLDATEEGQPLYRSLGFVERERSWFGHARVASLDSAALRARSGSARAHLCALDDLPQIAALDRSAFGGDRLELLRLIARATDCWLYTAGDECAPDGYLLVRELLAPRAGVRLGPWVAKSDTVGAALLEAALSPDAPWRARTTTLDDEPHVYLSTSAASHAALALFGAIGGALEEDDIVMRLDFADETPDGTASASQRLRAIAEHPEWLYSWLAPMVF